MLLPFFTEPKDDHFVGPIFFSTDRGLDNFMSMMQGSMLKPVTSQSMLHVHGEDPKPTGSPATLGFGSFLNF